MLSLSQIDYSFLSTWYAHLTFQFPSRMTAIRIGHTLDHNRLLPLYPSIVAAFVVGNTDGGVHLVQGRLLQRCTGRPTETWPYNTIQYNTMICNAHKVENRTSNLRRGLQSVINAAARLTTGSRRYDHVTLLLKDLHWLRVYLNELHTSCAFSSTTVCTVQRHATYKKSFSLSLKSLHDVDCGHHFHLSCWCR